MVGGSTAIFSKYAVGLVDTGFVPLGDRTRFTDAPARNSQLSISTSLLVLGSLKYRINDLWPFRPFRINNLSDSDRAASGNAGFHGTERC